jgi:hypothetical protein
MAQITIGFSTDPKSWVSRLIRWFTRSQCSHTFVTVEDQTLGRVVVESDAGGVQVVMWQRFNTPGNTVVGAYVPTVDLLPALKVAMTDYLNDEYDYSGVVGMAWVMLWRRLKRRVRNPLHRSKTLFCSAFVTRVLQIANDLAMEAGQPDPFPGAYALVPESTNAQDVWDFLQGKPVRT